jgi:16S rRNA (cytidine1402-2'-O)-methyltransferase
MTDLAPGLYVVATPIGNLGDLSPRAARVLREAAIVAAEDTRTTTRLREATGGLRRLISLTEHNVAARIPGLIEVAASGPVVLVSDAGTPALSDPGARLVEAAHAAGLPVFAVPGPSALAAAVSVAGFPGEDVHFLGFLRRPKAERRARLEAAAAGAAVLVFYESPARLRATLQELTEWLGDPELALCRELTKLHEETIRGPASAVLARLGEVRGECTVVVRSPATAPADEAAVVQYLAEMNRAGASRSAAAAEAARRFRVPRSRCYALWPGQP